MKDLWTTALGALLFVGIAVGGAAGFIWLLNGDNREREEQRQECLWDVQKEHDSPAGWEEMSKEEFEWYLDVKRQYCNDAYGRNR